MGALQTLKDKTSGGAVTVEGKPGKVPTTFPAMLTAYRDEIARALPRHMNADTMLRVALTAFRLTPKLRECHPASVFAAVIQASQLGLRPNMLGECFLIPFKDECQLIIGYQGLLQLARRSGEIASIGAYLVHVKDQFAVSFGTEPGITHVPYLDSDPGDVRFGYAVAKLHGGGTHVELMRLDEILRIRDRSSNVVRAKKAGYKTPWDTDPEEMMRKTLIRRICKYLPKSPELATALAIDAADGRQALNVDDAVAGVFVPPAVAEIADNSDTTPPPERPAPPSGTIRREGDHAGTKDQPVPSFTNPPADPDPDALPF